MFLIQQCPGSISELSPPRRRGLHQKPDRLHQVGHYTRKKYIKKRYLGKYKYILFYKMQQAAENVAGSTSEKQAPRRVICDLRSTGKVSISLPQIHSIFHPSTTCTYLLQPPEPARRPVGIIRGRGTPRPSSEVVRRQYMPPCAPRAGHPPPASQTSTPLPAGAGWHCPKHHQEKPPAPKGPGCGSPHVSGLCSLMGSVVLSVFRGKSAAN